MTGLRSVYIININCISIILQSIYCHRNTNITQTSQQYYVTLSVTNITFIFNIFTLLAWLPDFSYLVISKVKDHNIFTNVFRWHLRNMNRASSEHKACREISWIFNQSLWEREREVYCIMWFHLSVQWRSRISRPDCLELLRVLFRCSASLPLWTPENQEQQVATLRLTNIGYSRGYQAMHATL